MTSFKKILVTAVLMFGTAIGINSMADDTTVGGPPSVGTHHHHHHGGFFLGVCVGQKLATATPPVILVPGQHDPTVKAAIKAAKESCKAAFKASHPGSNS